MLELAAPRPMQTIDAASSDGGFLWWYVDLRGDTGQGLVVIWSLGLPFVPGRSRPLSASHRPAVSVAHYRDGEQQLYLLQDYQSADASLDLNSGSGTIGQSSYELRCKESEVQLLIELDEPIPSSSDRFKGSVRVTGPAIRLPASTSLTGHHLWAPKTIHAEGEARLMYGGATHCFRGGAYVDSNLSDTPLQSQGIRSWRWGRLRFPSYTVVYYEVEEADGSRLRYLYRQSASGGLQRVLGRLSFNNLKRGRYGLVVPHAVLIGAPGSSIVAEIESLVEDGPFYTRALLKAQDEHGNTAAGFCETVVPNNVDRPWQRPLVRMRTHHVGQSNSVFLPLFNGPRKDRTDRLFNEFTTRWARA